MIDAGLEVRAFFTTREGGVSARPYSSLNVAQHVGDEPRDVATNRAIVGELAGTPVTFLKADHGIRVARILERGEDPPTADALVTDVPGVAIAAIAADCVPVLIHDAASGAVAAVHAGREGLFGGVIDATIAALLDIRGGWRVPGEMSASIGPAICGQCYEVPEDLRARVGARHPSAFATTRSGTPALDLPRAVETRLGQLGLEQIVRIRECTAESDRLFSHRRDGATGRFAGVIVCDGQ
ncbi:peptidoglycan editing factor PgeF [Demequina activiva]|uniref:Purine nucleoside phosphorylase n=1 Tax=Demequina activiva TaxID=1582364 RepID=A0A919UGB9_9MICO|nr:peptidoglycan editing factor PgeF [Demequina activiva]GIG54294.1 laccase domain protein [Demequina activiva]